MLLPMGNEGVRTRAPALAAQAEDPAGRLTSAVASQPARAARGDAGATGKPTLQELRARACGVKLIGGLLQLTTSRASSKTLGRSCWRNGDKRALEKIGKPGEAPRESRIYVACAEKV